LLLEFRKRKGFRFQRAEQAQSDQNAKIGSGAKNATEVFTTSSPAYATFTVPRPKNIYSCRCFKRGVGLNFTGKHTSEIKSTKFAQISVLAYDIGNPDLIRLTGLPGFARIISPMITNS
jgi:hypothetical protein